MGPFAEIVLCSMNPTEELSGDLTKSLFYKTDPKKYKSWLKS